MKITTNIWTKEKGWHKIATIYYGLLSWRVNIDFCFGIGYFTSYENKDVLVKTILVPFCRIDTTYEKIKRVEK